jgi:hypothetical protein
MVGDLVLRLKQDGHGKLESPWLGAYIVTKVIPGGAYWRSRRLEKMKAIHGTRSSFDASTKKYVGKKYRLFSPN